MIPVPTGVRVWLATGHTDMRKGFDGLALLVQETLRRDPHCGHLFVFRGRRGDLLKVLWHDGQGLCLYAKRLERGRFLWPSPADGVVTITPAQLGYLLEGIDWRACPREPGVPPWPAKDKAWLLRVTVVHLRGDERHRSAPLRPGQRSSHDPGRACGPDRRGGQSRRGKRGAP